MDDRRPMPRPASSAATATAWTIAGALLVAGAVRGDALLAVAAGGAMVLAGLPRFYTALSGIVLPRALAPGILIFCLAAFGLGEVGGFYTRFAWWDIALHLVASSVLALAGWAMVLLLTEGGRPRTGLWIGSILAVSFAALVGGAWELMEFSIDALFGTNAQRSGLPDTMGDVAVNIVGATYGAIAAQAALKRGARPPLSGLLVEFCAANPVIYGQWTDRHMGGLETAPDTGAARADRA
ncbi:hypothetical protein [Wenxinia saemankumensis]|uniref:DUF2238 domain-containing protein n=1 Tax=Wenxinia saemankumensis TaxID=1447782 RepID=A0A1M6B0E5_9RHOB|nr:hypothetical protein [Wenxinia saemankumensis]SHI42219.1 hypothetical protein SAMN05444417_0718 [Wenxinia saemankumensis]